MSRSEVLSHLRVAALAAAFLLTWPAPSAGCSTAGCPLVTQNPDGSRPRGSWTIDLSFRGMNQDGLRGVNPGYGGASGALIDFENRRMLPGHHQDSEMRHRLFEARIAYGIRDRVTLFASVPLWNDRRHGQRDFERNVGVPTTRHVALTGPQALAATATPHEQRGLGDLQLGAGFLIASGPKRSLFLQASVKAPSGSTGRLDALGSIDRPDLQPGSGSWDGIVSLVGQRRIAQSSWSLFGGVYGRLNGESGREFRFGHEASFSLGLTSGRVGRLRPSLQIGYRVTGIDRYIGRAIPSTGMRVWAATPGLRLRARAGAALYLYAKIPLATAVNGAQLGPRVDILAGLSRTF